MENPAAACLFASALAVLPLTAFAGSGIEAACVAARNHQLATLEKEALSISINFDADIAVAGSPEYQLMKDKEALLREIAADKQAARERYRRCAAGKPPR